MSVEELREDGEELFPGETAELPHQVLHRRRTDVLAAVHVRVRRRNVSVAAASCRPVAVDDAAVLLLRVQNLPVVDKRNGILAETPKP